ncbi:ESPR-type extended signal peptide-containing protein, partial [Burkholderia pseudomallei]
MNKIYRKVWNKARGQLVVASELASSRSSVGEASVDAGRSGDQTGSAAFTSEERNPGSGRMIPLAIAVALMFSPYAWAGVGGADNGVTGTSNNGGVGGSSGGGGVQFSDMGVAFVGDGDCSMLTSGPGSYAGVYGSGSNYLGGLFGFGAQTSAVGWGTPSNAGANSGIVPYQGAAQTFGNVTYAGNGTQSGNFTQALGLNSFAAGCGAHAAGLSATAIGWGTTASGAGSVALGLYSTASGQGSLAFGTSATATATDTIALGTLATANAVSGVAIGANTQASAANATAIGGNSSGANLGAQATAAGATAIGG